MSGEIRLKIRGSHVKYARKFFKFVKTLENGLAGPTIDGCGSYGSWLELSKDVLTIAHTSYHLNGNWSKAIAVALSRKIDVAKVDWDGGWEDASGLPKTYPFKFEIRALEKQLIKNNMTQDQVRFFTEELDNYREWSKIMLDAATDLIEKAVGEVE